MLFIWVIDLQATSTRLNTLTQVCVTGISSLVVAFVHSWKLTLLVLAFVPFIAAFGAMQTKLNTSFAQDEQKNALEAGAVSFFFELFVTTQQIDHDRDLFITQNA